MSLVDDSAPVFDTPRLPTALDAEGAVLGAILLSPKAWTTAAEIIGAGDFYRVAHRYIWDAMARLATDTVAIDELLLVTELRRTGRLADVGGPSYLADLTHGVPKATNVRYYAEIVREKAKLRMVIDTVTRVAEMASQADADPASVVDLGVRHLLDVTARTTGGIVTFKDALAEFQAECDSEQGLAIPTGLIDVDDITGGFWQRDLSILAARPSVGKTSLLMTIAVHIAKAQVPTGIITLEMAPSSLAGNVLGAQSGVSSNTMRRKVVPQHGYARISHALEELNGLPCLFFVSGAYTITQVLAQIRMLVERHGVRLVGIDYLQLIGDPSFRNRQQEVAGFSRALSRLAKELGIAIVALSQLSRAPEARTDKRPQLSDLRESGSLEQDADMVWIIFREEMYKPKDGPDGNRGIAEIIIAKNRQGPTGTPRVKFVADTAKFVNLARGMF